MADAATRRPELLVPIERDGTKRTGGNEVEPSLFGAHPGSVRISEAVDLIAPALDIGPDAETGREVAR